MTWRIRPWTTSVPSNTFRVDKRRHRWTDDEEITSWIIRRLMDASNDLTICIMTNDRVPLSRLL